MNGTYPQDSQLIELARASGSLSSVSNQLGVSRVSLTNYLLRRPTLNRAVRAVLVSKAGPRPGSKRVQLAARHRSSSHPDIPNKSGTNWVEQEGGLPPFIKRVAKHIMADSGYSTTHAIKSAISQCKKWAAQGNAKAAAAVAQWEALKAKAHSHANPRQAAIELATYSSQQLSAYYQKPAGSQTKAKGKKKVVRTEAGAKRYKVPIGSEIGSARNADAAKAQQNKGAVDKYKSVVGAKDRDAQVAKLNPTELGQLSQVAFSWKTSDPNVVALRNSIVGQLRKRGMDPRKYGYLGGGPAPKAPAKKVMPPKKTAPAKKR